MLPNAELVSALHSRQILHGSGHAYSASQICLSALVSVAVFKLPHDVADVSHRMALARSLFHLGFKQILGATM